MNRLGHGRRSLALILAAGAGLQLAYGLADRAPDFDEAIYMGLARGIARAGLPVVVENSSVFLLHPPLFYYLESIPYLIDEPPLLIARLPSTVLSLLTLGLLYEICSRAWGRRRALAAAALLAVNPAFVYYSHSVYMEPTVTCLGMLALALWFRSPPEGPRAGLAGLAGGGAFLAKYLGAFFPLAILAAAATPLAGHPRYRAAWRLLVVFLCTAAVWPLFGLFLDPHDFLDGLAFFLSAPPAPEAAYSWRVAGTLRYVTTQVGVITPALVVLALAGLALDIRGTRRATTAPETRGVLVAATMVVLTFGLFCLLASRRDVKYFVPALPLLALFGARPLLALLDRCRNVAARAAAVASCALFLTPMTWLFNPIDGSWHPNIVVFGLQRDDRYRDLARLGAMIRQERLPGARVVTEAKSSVVGYYGDLEAIDIWGLPWPDVARRLSGADYYVTASDASYLDAEAVRARDALLAAEFEPVISLHSDGITQSLHRRKARSTARSVILESLSVPRSRSRF